MTETTKADTVCRRAASLARLGTSGDGANFVASKDTAIKQELADKLNDSIRELLNFFPLLNVVSTTLTTTAGVATIELPDTLRINDVLSVNWDDAGARKGEVVMPIDRHELEHMRPGLDTVEWPSWYYLEWGVDSNSKRVMTLVPTPFGVKTLRLWYRVNPAVMGVNDVGEEGTNANAQVVPVPDDMIELLALGMAYRLSAANMGVTSAEAQGLKQTYDALAEDWVTRLASTPHQGREAVLRNAGFPARRTYTSFRDLMIRNYKGY